MNIATNNTSGSYIGTDFSGVGIGANKSADTGTGAGKEITADKAKRTGSVECQTCRNRKYQDVSNDPGVSFKTPGRINPKASGAVVMSHEQEHVRNESARALREDRKIVSQSVRLQTSVCPECGTTYVSGGTTTTVTKSDNSDSSNDNKDYFLSNYNDTVAQNFGMFFDVRV